MPGQPGLFDPPAGDSDPVAELAREHQECATLAARLPPGLRFGTSSWSFPGWVGRVWSRKRPTAWLAKHGLEEYARHPLLRTVGIDRGFYAAIPEPDLTSYASQLPSDFLATTKAPAAVTSAVLPEHRPGARRDQPNPHYLDSALFLSTMLEPFARSFAGHCGPFLLQFPPASRKVRPAPGEFAERLDAFLSALPRDFRYAVELRDADLVTPAYCSALARHGAAHVYNYAGWMPAIAIQERDVPIETAPFTVIRLLLRPGTGYEERRDLFEPFDRIVDADPVMRGDVSSLIGRATMTRRDIFVLVNNKAEGSAPLTIRALASLVAGVGG